MVSYDISTVLQVGGQRLVEKSVTVTGGSDLRISESIPIANDTLIAFACDVSQLKAIVFLADQNLTIETNADDAAGGQTIALTANKLLIWYLGCGTTNPLTPDITALYVTNASAAVATLQIFKLEDPTV
jgi:hypothetical protein